MKKIGFIALFLFVLPAIAGEWKTCCDSGCDYSPTSPGPVVIDSKNYCCCNDGWHDCGSDSCSECCETGKPDLVITDIWREGTKIWYKVKNQGDVPSGNFYSNLTINGEMVSSDLVLSLDGGEEDTEDFYNYELQCTGEDIDVVVCADKDDTVDESSESNNCMETTFKCSYSASLEPSWFNEIATSKTETITLTDSSSGCCNETVTYTLTYSKSGECSSVSVPDSLTVDRGGETTFTISLSRSGSYCTVYLEVKSPKGNVVDHGTYTVRSSSTTTTTTTPPSCDNDGICEDGETQENCEDCVTTVQLSKSDWLLPGEEIEVTVTFTDCRYTSGKDARIELSIIPQGSDEGVEMDETNGCYVCGKRWTEIGWDSSSSWHGKHMGKDVSITSEDCLARITFTITVPDWLPPGTHTIKATPTIVGSWISLKSGRAVITIDSFQLIVQVLRGVLRRMTGLFFLVR